MQKVDRSVFYPGGSTGIVLNHGLGGTPVELRYLARGLARAGYTVYCPTLAGHCGSEADLRGTGWQDWYASVEEAHAWLTGECDRVVAGGLSMGAVLALHLAARRPDDVDALMLFAPTLKLDGWSVPWRTHLFRLVTQKWCANLFPFQEKFPYGIKDRRFRQMIVDALHSGDSSTAGNFSAPGGTVLELRWLAKTVRRELASVQQPTLLMHSRDDDRSSIESNAFYIQRHLGGMVDMVVLDDSYHLVTIDRQKDLVVTRASEFMTRIDQALAMDGAKGAVASTRTGVARVRSKPPARPNVVGGAVTAAV